MNTHAPELDIRAAHLDDLDALLALEQASFTGDRLSRRQYRHHLNNAGARILVATHTQRLVGSALILFRRGTRNARLYSLAIEAQMQGQGIGRLLLDAVATEAGTRGCTRLRLEVRTDNAAAIALYARSGFETLHTRPGYYEEGADAQVMQRVLGDPVPPPVQ